MMDVSEDLYPSHDNRTVDMPLGGADIWPYQQFDRATDRADGSASVAGAAATPSARQLGSSTDSCSEPNKQAELGKDSLFRQALVRRLRHTEVDDLGYRLTVHCSD